MGHRDPNLNCSKLDQNALTNGIINVVHRMYIQLPYDSCRVNLIEQTNDLISSIEYTGTYKRLLITIDGTLLMYNRPDSVTKEHLNFISLKILLNRYSIGENKY